MDERLRACTIAFSYFPPIVCDRLSIGCGRPILQLPSKRLSLRKPTHAPYAGDVFAIAVRCLASPPFDSCLQENVMAIRAFYSQR